MKSKLLTLFVLCSFINRSVYAQLIATPYVAVVGSYQNYSSQVSSSFYPVLGVMGEHNAGQKMIISTGYGGGLLDMFTKISSWSRRPTTGNIDSTNYIAIGENWSSYTPGSFIIDGNVGIGTLTPHEKLSVNGNIRSKEIKVEATNWPDYVFEADYKVGTLEALESYIKTNKHLPEMPSAKEVETNGVALGEMNKLLLKKIEELTLFVIELKKENELIKREIKLKK